MEEVCLCRLNSTSDVLALNSSNDETKLCALTIHKCRKNHLNADGQIELY